MIIIVINIPLGEIGSEVVWEEGREWLHHWKPHYAYPRRTQYHYIGSLIVMAKAAHILICRCRTRTHEAIIWFYHKCRLVNLMNELELSIRRLLMARLPMSAAASTLPGILPNSTWCCASYSIIGPSVPVKMVHCRLLQACLPVLVGSIEKLSRRW